MSSREYYSCDKCHDAFDEYDPGGWCMKCDKHLCPDCYTEFIEERDGECLNGFDENECPFCNKSVVGDADLLAYALGMLNTTRDELEANWKNTDG